MLFGIQTVDKFWTCLCRHLGCFMVTVGGTSNCFGKFSFLCPERRWFISANQRVARKFVEVRTYNKFIFNMVARQNTIFSHLCQKKTWKTTFSKRRTRCTEKGLGCPTQMTDANQPPSCADPRSFVHKVWSRFDGWPKFKTSWVYI